MRRSLSIISVLLLVVLTVSRLSAQIETTPDSVFRSKMNTILHDFYTPVEIADTVVFLQRCFRLYQYNYMHITLRKNGFVIPDDTLVHPCEETTMYAGFYARCSEREQNYLLLAYIYVLLNKPGKCLNFYFTVGQEKNYGGSGQIAGRKQIDVCFAAYWKMLSMKQKHPSKSFRYLLEKELRRAKIKWVFE
ncbi:MAG: hypothetical protein ACK5Z2_02915 [Bacteroidota bacterium]|jgi:hypothetical protein